MRIVCDQCQAKYIVPDEKIVKNVLRLTCQKCGNVITTRVNGSAPEPSTPSGTLEKWRAVGSTPKRSQDSETPVWYYSSKGESIGPFTEEELKAKLVSLGDAAAQCFIWRKTFSKWLPVREVEPFASAIVMPPPPPPPAPKPKAAPASDALPPLFAAPAPQGTPAGAPSRTAPDLLGLKQKLRKMPDVLPEIVSPNAWDSDKDAADEIAERADSRQNILLASGAVRKDSQEYLMHCSAALGSNGTALNVCKLHEVALHQEVALQSKAPLTTVTDGNGVPLKSIEIDIADFSAHALSMDDMDKGDGVDKTVTALLDTPTHETATAPTHEHETVTFMLDTPTHETAPTPPVAPNLTHETAPTMTDTPTHETVPAPPDMPPEESVQSLDPVDLEASDVSEELPDISLDLDADPTLAEGENASQDADLVDLDSIDLDVSDMADAEARAVSSTMAASKRKLVVAVPDDETTLSEESRLIQSEYMARQERAAARKRLLLAIIAVIVVALGAVLLMLLLGDDTAKPTPTPEPAKAENVEFAKVEGRTVSQDELPGLEADAAALEADADEAAHDAPVDAKKDAAAKPSKKSKGSGKRPKNDGNADGDEATDDAKPAPAVKQDGRANVVLGGTEDLPDFASTESVQGSKYANQGSGADAYALGLRRVSTTVQECYRREAKNGNMEGVGKKIYMQLRVKPDGSVSKYQLEGTVPDSFKRCLDSKKDRWKFEPFEGSEVSLRQAFVL